MKRLREILEKFLFYYIPHNGVYQPAHIDQAIKEIQELCEPMSREDIEKIVATKLRTTPIAGDFDRTRCIYANEAVIQSLIDELVGKLSTPRLMDWEKVLPMKWKEAKHLGKGKCGEYYVKGANRMRTDCLSALKSMSEPRLMEECPVSQEEFIKVCEFLSKEGYLDDDWWCENPTALERYLKRTGKIPSVRK